MSFPGSTTYPGNTTYPGSPNELTFTGPYIERGHVEGRLRFKTRYGVSVYRVAGVWAQSESPDYTTVVAVTDRFYAGGHVHIITVDQAAELTAAGFGAYIT